MYLKSLKLNGFKSFARSTTLEFPHSISAIVGPNGSGKSNVAEAVAWVLGEQSFKSLRARKGEDIIFNGSSSAPRMGKASVALAFVDPQEQEEVFVSRAVYQDGLNEYFINDSRARLKDIIDFLSKLGVGPTRHHIIGQGEADRILNVSSKERKEMLEDALGLRIHQLKKEEGQRKLERTQDNIRQIESLRQEIQPHLRFLKRQVEKVKKSVDLTSEKELKEREISETEEKIKELKTELAKFKKIESFVNFLEKKVEEALGEKDIKNIKNILLDILGAAKENEKVRKLERELFQAEVKLRETKNALEFLIAKEMQERGGVGVEILKEYEEVKSRDDFLASELLDLEKTAGSLKDLMGQLEERLNSDFENGIEKINKEFQKFFELMFGGGRAELKKIENGLDFYVNLPRKRIRSLDMLSGGERALTSIALLFAVSQVNPPPFLVLDETDAALDESNSSKYAKMLRGLSKRTQLVLITHNRETMKVAGILYGVTMGSDSISRLLSIKLDQAEELIELTS